MRVIKNLTGTLLIAGIASVAYARSPRVAAEPMYRFETSSTAQQEQETPPKQDEKKPQQQTKEARTPPIAHQQAKQKQSAKAGANEQRDAKEQPRQETKAQQQPREGQKQHGQGDGAHGRISDNDYKAHFGRPHSFAVRQVVTTTRIVPNQTHFVYGGYSFVFLAAWPSDWLLTDECYIDYVDGEYVLIDVAHPGMTIALEIAG